MFFSATFGDSRLCRTVDGEGVAKCAVHEMLDKAVLGLADDTRPETEDRCAFLDLFGDGEWVVKLVEGEMGPGGSLVTS